MLSCSTLRKKTNLLCLNRTSESGKSYGSKCHSWTSGKLCSRSQYWISNQHRSSLGQRLIYIQGRYETGQEQILTRHVDVPRNIHSSVHAHKSFTHTVVRHNSSRQRSKRQSSTPLRPVPTMCARLWPNFATIIKPSASQISIAVLWKPSETGELQRSG